MRVRLFTLLVVPAAASLILASLIVLDRNGDYRAANEAFAVAELADRVEALDKALGNEALAASKIIQPDATYPRDVRVSNFRRSREETDTELADVASLLDANSYQAEIRLTVEVIEATLAFRDDIEGGFASPLQILDRYSYIRSLLLDSLSHQAAVLVSAKSQQQILALVDLIAARSAHLDERVGVELALRYSEWAPGLRPLVMMSIARQETHLDSANRFLPAGEAKPPGEWLVRFREQLAVSADASAIKGANQWTKSSDVLIHRLDTVIEKQRSRTKQLLGSEKSTAASTQLLTLAGVGGALAVAMLLTLVVSVRLVRRVSIITSQARRMASERPTERTYPRVRGSDELGQLATAFDEMISKVDTRTTNQWIESTVLEAIVHGSPIEEVLETTATLLGSNEEGLPLYHFNHPDGPEPSPTNEPYMPVRPELMPTACNPLDGLPDSPESRTAVGLAMMAVQREADQARLEWRASRDELTGLLNRGVVLDQAMTAAALSHGADQATPPPGMMYLDLDHFKDINDQFGHAAGDHVLKTQAARIAKLIEPFGGIVGRIGGDEFLVILPTIRTGQNLMLIAEEVVERLCQPIPAGGGAYHIGVSIGCVLSRPGVPPAQLLTDADFALYEAKRLGRGRALLSTKALRDRVTELEELRRAVPLGIETGQFVPWFQPIWANGGRSLVGMEALVRWQHPTRVLVSPSVFLPVAEELNILSQLDRSMFEAVCRQVVSWRQSGLELELVHYNLSTAWLEEPDFVEETRQILEATGCDPGSIVAEVTESGLMTDITSNCHSLQALREIGIQIAVDDFGQGYSSLAYLSDLPVDLLKIDRRFVDRIDEEESNQAIVAAVLSLGQSLGLRIIAEGVERQEELAYLSNADCELLQGYYLAKPAPAAETTALIGRSRRTHSSVGERLRPTPTEGANAPWESADMEIGQ